MPFLYNGENGDDDYIDDPGGGDDIFYLMDHTLPEPYITYIIFLIFAWWWIGSYACLSQLGCEGQNRDQKVLICFRIMIMTAY